jgi:hypothetical protein
MGEKAIPLADVVAARDIPFVFLTGYGCSGCSGSPREREAGEKSATAAMVCRALEATFAARSKDACTP